MCQFITRLSFIVLIFSQMSCSNLFTNFTSGVLATGGALILGEKYKDNPRAAAYGAGIGFAAGQSVAYFQDKEKQKSYEDGYYKASSDSVKKLYWLRKASHRSSKRSSGFGHSSNSNAPSLSYYEIPVPAYEKDGVFYNHTTRVISIYD